MDEKELHEIIALHGKWIRNGGGKRADLCGADLSGAILRFADLRMANLRNADLSGADLRWANLRGASLCKADMREADLRVAELSGCNLREADLCGVKLSGADLRGVILSEKIVQVGPIGSRNSYTVYFVDRDIVQCGCWNNWKGGSLEQFEARVDEVYPDYTMHPEYRREYLAAIAMFKALKEG